MWTTGSGWFLAQAETSRSGHQTETSCSIVNNTRCSAFPTETEPPFGNPEVLFAGPYLSAGGAGGHTYDVSPDGDRFLMLKVIGEEDGMAEPHINVVLNWFEELERLAPTP